MPPSKLGLRGTTEQRASGFACGHLHYPTKARGFDIRLAELFRCLFTANSRRQDRIHRARTRLFYALWGLRHI
jgi:hypothetical protein